MLKIHLAQIYFNPAYYDAPANFIEEPSFLNETDRPLGTLRAREEISQFLEQSKISYLGHIRSKIIDVVKWSGGRQAHILAFPEYSVPYPLLLDLVAFAREYKMLIVAGTHRVPSDQEAKTIYRGLGLTLNEIVDGSAISPIIFPDGTVSVTPKLKRSKWEANLVIPHGVKPITFAFSQNKERVEFAVVPCIDSLHPEVLGELWNGSDKPALLVCPSLTPTVALFHNAGSMVASKDTLFACVNSASFGGSFFQIPARWEPYLKGFGGGIESLPKESEAILEIEVAPDRLFLKKGSIENPTISTHPLVSPLVYQKSSPWLDQFNSFKSDVVEWLSKSEPGYAIDG